MRVREHIHLAALLHGLRGVLLTSYFLLPTTYYLLLTTYSLLPATYYLLPATCYLLLATCTASVVSSPSPCAIVSATMPKRW